MERGSSDCVELDVACKVLVKSRAVQSLIETAIGAKRFKEALGLMTAGKLEGDLGAEIHDLLIDAIRNDALEAWSGLIRQPHDDYSIQVNGYHGVYWVWAVEYDPVGYFLDRNSAISYAKSNWDVSEDGDAFNEDDEESGNVRCPYCNTAEDCGHLLLVADQTFRHAEGGVLYEAFNSRWSAITSEEGDGADERCLFDALLEQVDALADAESTACSDTAPGLSSTYTYYFCSSKKKAIDAKRTFSVL